jgi:hypothetical protein
MMIHQFIDEVASSAADKDEQMAILLCLLQLQTVEES